MTDDVVFRPATSEDLAAIVALFAADDLGGHGDTDDPALRPLYAAALEEILASPVDRLVVGEMEGRVIATGQLTFVRSLPHRGRKRAIVEAVQVDGSLRNRGVGARLIAHLVELSRSEGAGIVELTSNAARIDAHRFYDRLGFAHSHVAFKLKLEP